MSMKRWKVLACTLTVGVGGLVVYGAPFGKKVEAQNAKDKAPVTVTETKAKEEPAKPVIGLALPGVPTPELDVPIRATSFGPGPIPPLKADEKPMPTKGMEFDIDIPLPPAPVKKIADDTAPPPVVLPLPATTPSAPPVILPVGGQTAEPPLLLPAGGIDKKDAPKKDEPKKIDTPKVPDLPKVEETKPPVKIDVPALEIKPTPPKVLTPVEPTPPPKVLTPPAPPAPPIALDPPPSVPPMDLLPPKVPAPEKKPDVVKPGDTAKLKMLLRMGDGKPRFEIRNTQTTELLMKVYGDKIDIQNTETKSTLTGVTANGNVRFTAPGVEGTCDTLTILSTTGEVMLKGNIRLKTKYGKTTSELTAEKMVYQIGTQGLVAPIKPTTPGTTASHIRD